MKNKKILYLLVALILVVVSSSSIISYADDSDSAGTYKFTSSTSTLEIFSDEIMIDQTESKISEYPWYSYKASIEHIVIHDGVTKISDYAFCKEDNLVDVVIPDSVTHIGTAAFAGDNNLKDITIPNSVTYIGSTAIGFDTNMNIISDFQCNCEANSYAQFWCLQNYVPFNTPFNNTLTEYNNTSTTYTNLGFWSFVPSYDCNIKFYSQSNYDTVGMIFDYDSYTYSTDYTTFKNSAIYYNDDCNDSVNFQINATLKAGHRYYLSSRYKLSNRTGTYSLYLEEKCLNHNYEYVSIEEDFMTDNYDTVNLHCTQCNNDDYISFSEAVKDNYSFCDLNNDGIVNAKDYAIMINQ